MLYFTSSLDKEPNCFRKLLVKTSIFYEKSLEHFHLWIIESIDILNKYSYTFVKNLGIFLYQYFLIRWRLQGILFIFIFIPKTIILISLLLDVFVFERFHYFYLTSFLIILPLLERYFKYILEFSCKRNFEQTDEILVIIKQDTNEKISAEEYSYSFLSKDFSNKNYLFSFKKEYLESIKNIDYDEQSTIEIYLNILHGELIKILNFLFLYGLLKNQYIDYFHLFLYYFYAIIWSYIFIYAW